MFISTYTFVSEAWWQGVTKFKNPCFQFCRLRRLHVMGKKLGVNWLLEAHYWACLYRMSDGLNEQIKYHVLPSNPIFLNSLLCSINISRSLLYVWHCVWHWKDSNKNFTLKTKQNKTRNKKQTSHSVSIGLVVYVRRQIKIANNYSKVQQGGDFILWGYRAEAFT